MGSKMIHYFGLEPNEARYTGYLDRAITNYLTRAGREFIRYYPDLDVKHTRPPSHAFFDPASTLAFRSGQLAEFGESLADDRVHGSDLLFFSDLLMPGPEAIAWTARLVGIHLRIRGLIHGGSFNEHDIMHEVERWAAPLETSVLDLCEEAYVGSDYSRLEIVSKRLVDPRKIVNTGHLIDPDLPVPFAHRDPLVVLTSRSSPDKQPWLFKRLERELGDEALCVNAIEQGYTKAQYYELLSRATVVVSFALHETFGVGVQEAVALGCVPVVPNRLCYVEQFNERYRYSDFGEALELVRDALGGKLPVPKPVRCDGVVERWFA